MRQFIALFLTGCLNFLLLVGNQFVVAYGQTSRQPLKGLPIIRDAEIEELLRLYSKPILRAAGLAPKAVSVYLINSPDINAFVADGRRIFIYTGLLTQAKTPNEVIGVLAHETGHIAGGHLARLGIAIDQANAQSIIGMLLGAAAMIGGAWAKSEGAMQAGHGVIGGTQSIIQRNILAYQRSMESSADQAAVKFLSSTHQSAKGMLDLFEKIAGKTRESLRGVNPYLLSHPMPLERLRNLEITIKASPYFTLTDSPNLLLRHALMQAKLIGFMQPIPMVNRLYPTTNKELPARYARAISLFRIGDLKTALPIIDGLITTAPSNPYFWELKGQALLESGQATAAIAPLQKSVDLSQGNGLIQIMLAHALVSKGDRASASLALNILRQAERQERLTAELFSYRARAYGILQDIPHANLATAQAAVLTGDKQLAISKSEAVQAAVGHNSPEWLQAKDILNFARRKH